MKPQLRLITNRMDGGPVRHARFKGQDHLVFPAVMLREQVLNCMNCDEGGELIPLSEIEESLPGWEGRPVTVLRHPTRNGRAVSANSREVLENDVVGHVFDARIDDGALKGDVWLTISATRRIVGGAEIVDRLEAGEMLEVSTGYFRAAEIRSGKHNGVEYALIQRDLIPDHFAVGLAGRGACSIDDGCGAPRINAEGESLTARVRAVEDAIWARNRDLEDADEEEDFWWPLDIYEDAVIVRQGGLLLEVAYTVADDGGVEFGKEKEVSVEYRPVENAAAGEGFLRRTARVLVRLASGRGEGGRGDPAKVHNGGGAPTAATTSKEDADMKRTERIAALAAAGIGFTAEELEKLSDEKLAALAGKVLKGQEQATPAGNGGCGCRDNDGQAANATPAGQQPAAGAPEGVQLAPEALQAAVQNAVREALGSTVTDLQQFVANQKATEEQEKEALVARLKANKACALEEAELKTLSLKVLKGLEQSLTPASYVGLGGPRGQEPGDDGAPDPIPMLLEAPVAAAPAGKEN